MKKMTLVVAFLSIFTASLRASDIELPFFGFAQHAECTNAEPVMISGTIYGSIRITTLKNGDIAVNSSFGPRNDVKAVGVDSGTIYNVVGHTKDHTTTGQSGELESISYTNTFNVIGLYKIHSTLKIDFTGPEPKVSIDNYRISCSR